MAKMVKAGINKSDSMLEEYERRKRKQVAGMKSLMDYGMGGLILLMGLVFIFRMYLGVNHPVNIKMGKPGRSKRTKICHPDRRNHQSLERPEHA